VDPKLVTMLADYMEKTASVSAIKDRALEIAKKMAGIRRMTGHPLIEGYDMVKKAMTMMTDHDKSLNLITMILDTMQEDHGKHAGLEPGYGVPAPKGEEPSAIEGLMTDCGIVR